MTSAIRRATPAGGDQFRLAFHACIISLSASLRVERRAGFFGGDVHGFACHTRLCRGSLSAAGRFFRSLSRYRPPGEPIWRHASGVVAARWPDSRGSEDSSAVDWKGAPSVFSLVTGSIFERIPRQEHGTQTRQSPYPRQISPSAARH
jgi:hypothetical protein